MTVVTKIVNPVQLPSLLATFSSEEEEREESGQEVVIDWIYFNKKKMKIKEWKYRCFEWLHFIHEKSSPISFSPFQKHEVYIIRRRLLLVISLIADMNRAISGL